LGWQIFRYNNNFGGFSVQYFGTMFFGGVDGRFSSENLPSIVFGRFDWMVWLVGWLVGYWVPFRVCLSEDQQLKKRLINDNEIE